MTLQQLRFFIEVAEKGSISKAANTLFISQPALSKHLKQLEKSLNQTLIVRTNIGIHLTDQGRRFLQKIKPLIKQLDSVICDTLNPTTFRFGSLPTLASYYFPKIAKQIDSHQLCTVLESRSSQLLDSLHRGEIDGAFVQDFVEDDDIRALNLFEEEYLVAIPSTHPFAHKTFITIDELNDEKIILPLKPCETRLKIENMYKDNSISFKLALETPYETILGYTAEGIGLSFIPEIQAEHVQHHGVVYRRLKPAALKRTLHFVTKSDLVYKMIQHYRTNGEMVDAVVHS
ncbi:LysR family transcriptional regulator [Alkalihalobacillus sp. TS-13]|uniref:LysR family transcriptional regulator n=1 Tax=Alkalihalobacillus sp. TS-13 TaxID=2842455 RepID=UPI001C875755|nr:LysR family transcriptional regulator [Alkalihalobacillus sp. TS-13]